MTVSNPRSSSRRTQQVAIDQRVTNIYRRENGAWKIVHHHADLSPAMLEILSRLQAQA